MANQRRIWSTYAGRGNVASNRWQALEAPEISYNPDTKYYYLFMAYDELLVHYLDILQTIST